MLLRRSESLAQRNFYGNLEIMFIKINEQKLNLFEGSAHGEKLFCLRNTFKEVKYIASNKIILHAKNNIKIPEITLLNM